MPPVTLPDQFGLKNQEIRQSEQQGFTVASENEALNRIQGHILRLRKYSEGRFDSRRTPLPSYCTPHNSVDEHTKSPSTRDVEKTSRSPGCCLSFWCKNWRPPASSISSNFFGSFCPLPSLPFRFLVAFPLPLLLSSVLPLIEWRQFLHFSSVARASLTLSGARSCPFALNLHLG